MDFRNPNNPFDFTELLSTYGNMGAYGTNHLKQDYHKDFCKGMKYIFDDIKVFAETYAEVLYFECSKVEKTLKTELFDNIMSALLLKLSIDISNTVVAFGDDEVAEVKDEEQNN